MLDVNGNYVFPWNHGEPLTAASLNAAIAQSTGASVQTVPPSSPGIGTLWYNPLSGAVSLWDGAEWVVPTGLPVGGGTLTGPLYYTATGSTTARSVQDRAGEVANVRDFGAIGNGTAVDTAAIQAAAASLTNGGILLFPAKYNFLLDATIFLNSGTAVVAYGATLSGAAHWNNPSFPPSPEGFGVGMVFFINTNWNVTTVTDHDIGLYGGTWIPGAASVERHGCGGFHLVKNMEVASVHVIGGASSFLFVSCVAVDCHDCAFTTISGSAFNHWSGFSDVKVRNNYITRDATNPGNVPSLEFTGSTSLNTEGHSTNFVCDGNQIYGCQANIYAIQVDETDSLSTVKNGIICNNQIDLTGFAGAGGIAAYGGSDNINIHHNTIRGISDYNCINVWSNGYGTPVRVHVDNNRILDSTRVSGGATLLTVLADNSTVLDNDIIGCTCTTPISVTGANVVVRTGSMGSGSGGSRGSVSGTNSMFEDYNIATAVKTNSAVLQSAQGFQAGSGSVLSTYLQAQTFTPQVQFGGASVGVTYSTQTGTYIQIGKLIYFTVQISLSSKGTSTGNATVVGLPFSQTGALPAPCSTISYANMVSVSAAPFMTLGSNVVQVFTAPSGTHLADTNFSNISVINFAGICTVA